MLRRRRGQPRSTVPVLLLLLCPIGSACLATATSAPRGRKIIPRVSLATSVPAKSPLGPAGSAADEGGCVIPTHPPPAEREVRELTTLDEWHNHVLQCKTPVAVVKFYQDGCRSCRALKPKYNQLAQQELCGATFFEVNLQRGREIFTQEQIRVAPSIHMYCNGLGRVSGVGFSGARVLSTMSDSLSKVLEPPRLAALQATETRTLSAPMRYAALIETLRALKAAPRLLEAQLEAGSAPNVSATRRTEAEELFAWLDSAGAGALSVDALAAATCALADDGTPLMSGCIAPLRLAAAGVAVERVQLEAAVEAVHGLRQQQRESGEASEGDADAAPVAHDAIDLAGLRALFAAQDAELRRRKQLRGEHVNAMSLALGAASEEGLLLSEGAARLASFDAALPLTGVEGVPFADFESMLAALDINEGGVLNGELVGRVVVRARL